MINNIWFKTIAGKINKIPEFYTIFARKIPDYIIRQRDGGLAEAKTSRPRPKFWPRGHFGLIGATISFKPSRSKKITKYSVFMLFSSLSFTYICLFIYLYQATRLIESAQIENTITETTKRLTIPCKFVK